MSREGESRGATTLRPTLGSFMAFCGAFVSLTVAVGCLALYRPTPGAGATMASTGLMTGVVALWLFGHRIVIAEGVLRYRDGFYRSRSIPLADIKSVRHEWARVNHLVRKLEQPRLRVVGKSRKQTFLINPEPFSREAVRNILALGQRNEQ